MRSFIRASYRRRTGEWLLLIILFFGVEGLLGIFICFLAFLFRVSDDVPEVCSVRGGGGWVRKSYTSYSIIGESDWEMTGRRP